MKKNAMHFTKLCAAMVRTCDIMTIVILCCASKNETEVDGIRTVHRVLDISIDSVTAIKAPKHIFIKGKGNTV